MADYWKSQPRKFCQYCKCWIADNKPSIEFHERGKNHKENVAAKISEIKKKSVEKAKQEKKMCKQFAAMEEAAMKAYEEDLKRMEMEARGLSVPAPAAPQPPANQQAKKEKKKKEEKVKPRRQAGQEEVWVEGRTDGGHLYYYSTRTGESRWANPEHSGGSAAAAAGPSSSAWMEAVSPDGYTYYYNTETGESSWEKPSDEELLPPGTLPETGGSSEATAESREAPDQPDQPDRPDQPEQPDRPDQPDQQTSAPKINFRKRKSEDPGEEEGGEERRIRAEQEETREETKTEEEQEVQRTAVEPGPGLEPEPEPGPGPGLEPGPEPEPNVKIRVKRARTSSPYGTWEKIKEEKDPYANVDLQLPQVEESSSSGAADLPPEPKPKFKERVITSLGDHEEGGEPATFRRNRGQNSKSRRLRQRDED